MARLNSIKMKKSLGILAIIVLCASQNNIMTHGAQNSENAALPLFTSGVIVGDTFNLEGIGVDHGITTKHKKGVIRNMGDVEKVFSLQKNQKVLLTEQLGSYEEFGSTYIYEKPESKSNIWMTPSILKTHNVRQAFDRRPRDSVFFTTVGVFTESVINFASNGLIKYKLVSKDPLPIYEVESGLRLGKDERLVNFLKEQKAFDDDLCTFVKKRNGVVKKNCMIYTGAAHVYRVWREGCIKNIYLAIDSAAIESMAKVVAAQIWAEKQLL